MNKWLLSVQYNFSSVVRERGDSLWRGPCFSATCFFFIVFGKLSNLFEKVVVGDLNERIRKKKHQGFY